MGVFIIIFAIVIIISVVLYNSLIGKKNQVQNAFASIDVQLKQRYDLIPNLVSAVKQYMQHEEKVLTNITEMRAKAVSGNLSNDEKVAMDNQISKALSGIMVAVENYPDLKASQNFMQLQASLNEVEEKISASRRAYNASVTSYNDAVQMFPTNIMASMMGFQIKEWFKAPEAQRENVSVKDLFNN